MNRTQVKSIPAGESLDRLIGSQVMGWRLNRHETDWQFLENGKPNSRAVGSFRPSTDISAARELLPYIKKRRNLDETDPLEICHAALMDACHA